MFYQVNKPFTVWFYQIDKNYGLHKTPKWVDFAVCETRDKARTWKRHFDHTYKGRVVKRTAPLYLESTNH